MLTGRHPMVTQRPAHAPAGSELPGPSAPADATAASAEPTACPQARDSGSVVRPSSPASGLQVDSVPDARSLAFLVAVVEASRRLAEATDLHTGIAGALAAIGERSGLDRVYVVRYEHDRRAGYFVAEHCGPGVTSVLEVLGSGPFAYADYEEVWRPLMAGCTYSSLTRAKQGRNADINRAVGTKSDLFVPVMVAGEFWGAIGFDDCTTERVYSEAEVQVLRGAAAALAAAISRDRTEAARLHAERTRADEAQALNALLEGVVVASRALLDEPEFDVGLRRWLSALAEAVDADRACLGGFTTPDDPGHVAITRVDWAKPGLAPLTTVLIPASTDFVAWAERLRRGESIWAHREDLHDPASVRYWEATHCFTNLLVPVVVDKRTVAWLGFDWCERRPWRPSYNTLLRTAADGVAAAIRRNDAVEAAIAAREARANESARLTEQLRVVVSSARELIDATDFETGLIRWLGRFGETTAAIRATFYDLVDHPETGVRTCRTLAEWTRPGITGSVHVSFLSPFIIDPRGAETAIKRLVSGECLAIHTDDCAEPMRSFLANQGNVTVIAVPIFLDGHQWGCLSFDHAVRREPNASDFAILQTASDTLAAILKRNEAVRTALAEREARSALLERSNAELCRRDALLTAAARSLESLLSARDFAPAVNDALRRMGEAGEMHRVKVILQRTDPAGASSYHELAYEWYAPGLDSQVSLGLTHFPNETVDFYLQPLHAGRSVWQLVDEVPNPLREAFQRVGMQSMGVVPIFAGPRYIGLVAFDDCQQRRVWSQSEMDALTIAARGIGAAIQHATLVDEKIEAVARERAAAARQRADELAAVNSELTRSNRLLSAAARASILLSGREDFDAAVVEAIGIVAQAAGFDRVGVHEYVDAHGQPGDEFWQTAYEWRCDGIAAQAGTPLGRGRFDDIPVFGAQVRVRDCVLEYRTHELPDAAFREIQESLGVKIVLVGDITVDGMSWGGFSCDDCQTDRRRTEEEKGVIAAAARAIGQAIHRRRLEHRAERLQRQILAEREQAALTRADELASVNALLTRRSRLLAAVTEVSQLLLSGDDPATLLQPIADILGPASGADRAGFMLYRPPDAGSARGYLHLVAEWVAPGFPRQSELASARVLNLDAIPIDAWIAAGQIIIHPEELDASLRPGREAAAIRSELGIPIQVDGVLWGSSGFDDCRGGRWWDEGEITALKIANALIANAVSRRRADEARHQAEASRHTAVQSERNRLAREIHDTLAQSFTGILLQLEAADLLREQGDPRAAERYRKIRDQARLGLAETRRTALALAPEALDKGLLSALTQLCQRSHVDERMHCTFTYEGLARRLGADREERLLRVAKEALSNAVRHGRATEVSLHLAFTAVNVTLTVTDNGDGFPIGERPGLGLPNMRAAVAEAGGGLSIASTPAAGTIITATVPLADPPSPKRPIEPPFGNV